MPLKLEIKRKLTAKSDRVKSVDLHPSEPWMLAALFNGQVHIWNIETQVLVKSFDVCELPVRSARFLARKSWLLTGSDDMQIRVFNYNTHERIHAWEAHSDYLRCIVVHPTQSFILSSSDDMTIKLWDWERQWLCVQVFEGHSHYVMQLAINPKDNNTFASASLDKTVKVWSLGQPHPNFTLEGHEAGINCLDYYWGGDKPYLVSGADDRLVKIWDYQTKACVQTLDGHSRNVSAVAFHPELPVILSGSEDGTVRVWHANTYRLENTLNYGLERVWAMACLRGSNSISLGYDEGSVLLKLGREEPAISMDLSGKLIFAKHAEILTTNLKALFSSQQQSGTAGEDSASAIQDGERLSLAIKSLGTCDLYPQTLAHNSNGRFFVACGDGEYIVSTALAYRNKSFSSAQEFVWSQQEATCFAIRDNSSTVKIFKNFSSEPRIIRPELGAEQIFGGWLLAVRGAHCSLAFYDWEAGDMVRRIELNSVPRGVQWNERGQLVSIQCEESTFLLHYFHDKVVAARQKSSASTTTTTTTEEGIEEAFDLLAEHGELTDCVKTAVWVGDCFLFTNAANRLQYFVGGELVSVAHLDRPHYILGYLAKENRVLLCDRDVNVVSYALLLSVLEYQTAVMREDFAAADLILPSIPREQRTRVAHFLERRGFHQQALAVTTDSEHKFDLALHLGKLDVAFELAQKDSDNTSQHKWKQLAEAASRKGDFKLAQECLSQARDFAALLLLSTSLGNASMLGRVGELAQQANEDNIAFLSKFLLQDVDDCLNLLVQSDRLPEALFFARTHVPSRLPGLLELLREKIKSGSSASSTSSSSSSSAASKVSQGRLKMAQSLANPLQYENLFPEWRQSIRAEGLLRSERCAGITPAHRYQESARPRDLRLELEACPGGIFSDRSVDEQPHQSEQSRPISAGSAKEAAKINGRVNLEGTGDLSVAALKLRDSDDEEQELAVKESSKSMVTNPIPELEKMHAITPQQTARPTASSAEPTNKMSGELEVEEGEDEEEEEEDDDLELPDNYAEQFNWEDEDDDENEDN